MPVSSSLLYFFQSSLNTHFFNHRKDILLCPITPDLLEAPKGDLTLVRTGVGNISGTVALTDDQAIAVRKLYKENMDYALK